MVALLSCLAEASIDGRAEERARKKEEKASRRGAQGEVCARGDSRGHDSLVRALSAAAYVERVAL